MERKMKKRRIGRQIIPDDLTLNILPKLPAKSLLRFKCVSKPWLTFITKLKYDGKSLVLSFLKSIQFVELVEAAASSSQMKVVPLDIPEIVSPLRYVDVIGSCNGLLCMLMKSHSYMFVLWNPWTTRYKTVPLLSNPLNTHRKDDKFGFGYDHSTADYKIVSLCWDVKSKRNIFNIYSRNTDSWENGKPFSKKIDVYRKHTFGTSIDRALHWQSTANVVFRFDLKDNKFRKILPPDDVGKRDQVDIGVFGGVLCMVRYNIDGDKFCMWRLEETEKEKKKKTKQHWLIYMSVPLCLKLLPSPPSPPRCPCLFIKNEVLVLRLGFNVDRFMLYIPIENTFREFEIQDIIKYFDIGQLTTYTKSLVSPACESLVVHEEDGWIKEISSPI